MVWIILSILISLGMRASGLSCYTCSDSSFDGERNYWSSCYDTDGSTPIATCSGIAMYCRTWFWFEDGIPASIGRDCVSARLDHDSSSAYMPDAEKCATTLAVTSSPIDNTACYYHCNSSDNCNSVSLSTLKRCSTSCGRSSSSGYCDYISGNCVCQIGRTGVECSETLPTTPRRRKCIQCNSQTDAGCRWKTTGAYCPGSEQYCSSTQTSIFNEGSVVRTVLIRGCSSTHVAVDACKFTSIYPDSGISGYNEYTCYSTCDTDNCNTNTPNGRVDGAERALLNCYQCTAVSGCRRSFCPVGSTHCKTTVNYVISDKVDERYEVDSPSSYKLMSIVRECATAAVTTGCTESTVGGLSFKNVTCQETCQDDGCNDGWPARPKCLQCNGLSNDSCLKSPTFASACSYPYQKYCVIKDTGLEEGSQATVDGYPRYIERGCSYVDIGTGCTKAVIRGKGIQSCNYTCSTDGCNVGNGSGCFKQTGCGMLAVILLCVAWCFTS